MGILTINNTYCGAITYPYYGLLYNYYAAFDSRKITSSDDWVIPTQTQLRVLADYLGAAGNYSSNTVGNKLKEIGTAYWNSPNTGATNESSFNGRGSGQRVGVDGSFNSFKSRLSMVSNERSATEMFFAYMESANSTFQVNSYTGKDLGFSIRLLYIGAGTPSEYAGNDLKHYRVVTIGTQTWLADNLAETRFRNGDIIPWHGATPVNYFTDAEWGALTTAGTCAYNNDVNNVAPGFSFPT